MENQALVEKAIEVIHKVQYLNLSTVTNDGSPWGSPVYTAFDHDLNFYWASWKENQHSQNIKNNPNVFVTIYDSTVPASTGFGVYLQGKARIVTNPLKMAKYLLIFYGRRGKQPRDVQQFLTKYPRRLFQFVPERVWVNGDSEINGNFIDIRTELDIKSLQAQLK